LVNVWATVVEDVWLVSAVCGEVVLKDVEAAVDELGCRSANPLFEPDCEHAPIVIPANRVRPHHRPQRLTFPA
jgi:hypothetical protein